jgi:hypothetical protein
MQRSIGIPLLGFWLTAAAAFAGPGDPFGGDDTGCVPAHKGALRCSSVVAKALAQLEQRVIACHLKQASQAFKAGHSSPGFDNAEENCTEGPSATSAKAKFDAVLAKYATCEPALLAAAAARRDTVLDDQTNPESLDALNGSFFCDDGSGLTIAEPGGDDGGWIPADAGGLKCAARIAKAYAKLVVAVDKCHLRAAKEAFGGDPFDDDACEQAAQAKYDAVVQKLAALGLCPACLVAAAPGLATDAVADRDARLGDVYPCPAPPTAPPCNDLGGGQCSDTCATPGYECVFVPTGFELTGVPGFPEIHGQDDCRCVPSTLRCENLSAAVCAVSGGEGLCATAAEQCADTGGGACTCQ